MAPRSREALHGSRHGDALPRSHCGAGRELHQLKPTRGPSPPASIGGPPRGAGSRGASPRTAAPAAGRVLNRPGSSPHFRFGGNFSSRELEHVWPQAHQKPVVPSLLLHHRASAHASTALGSHFLCQDTLAAAMGGLPKTSRGPRTFNFPTWLLEIGSALCISFQNNFPTLPPPPPFPSYPGVKQW